MFCPTRRKQATVALTAFLFLLLGTQPLFAEERPATYTDPVLGMEFVLVQGGTFVMGDITGRDKTASPAHRVTLSDFYMGTYEVTFEQYDQYCEKTGKEKPDDEGWGRGNRPVVNVNWFDAVDFTLWLSAKTGKRFRLPSEAEWEYAYRAGTSTRYWWGNQLGNGLANCFKCGSQWDGKMTAPVGSFPPNRYGLYDMAGNVYEWCLDSLHESYEGAPTDGSPWYRGNIREHITRSGSWYMPVREISAFARGWDSNDYRANVIGLRLVMEP